MKTLVVGATGATGQLLVKQLLERGQTVEVIVRSADKLPDAVKHHENLTIVQASLLDLSDAELVEHVHACHAVVSCLGHSLNFRGLYGQPRRLVTEATHRLCDAIKTNVSESPVKFVLMNTAGNSNRDLQEPISFGQQLIVGLIRFLLPPHADNEKAADYLRTSINRTDGKVEWVVVRPDTLLNEDKVSEYNAHSSPTRSAIFNAGQISRINVAHFMADLIMNEDTWQAWRWQMPVLYNKAMS